MHHVARRVPARFAGMLMLASLAACSERTVATEPALAAPSSARHSASTAAPTYLVLARGNGFGSDFAATVASLGGKIVFQHQGAGFAVVSGISAAGATQLAASNGIADVQANASVALNAPGPLTRPDISATRRPGSRSQTNPTLAGLYSFQWNMRAIHADAAWAHGKTGSAGVTVAILDTGIDYDANDLNGLVDLSRSASFIPTDDAIRDAFFPGRNAISDFNGHGTNVATQVSSLANDFAGVSSRTTLIGVKVLDADGNGDFGAILSGILYAADQGADVANMSLGGSFLKAGAGRLTSLLNRVFNYAKQRGMLIVVAAGNDSEDLDHNGNETDAFCDMIHVVCVSAAGPVVATGSPDLPAFYTNFGRSAISVAGPGGNADLVNFPVSLWPWGFDFVSWVWSDCSKTFIAGFIGGTPFTPCSDGTFVTAFIGTSQATPHVSGLAALLVAANGHGKPQQIRLAIEKSADDLGQPGTDPYFGRGRINVARALGF